MNISVGRYTIFKQNVPKHGVKLAVLHFLGEWEKIVIGLLQMSYLFTSSFFPRRFCIYHFAVYKAVGEQKQDNAIAEASPLER